MAIKKYHVSKNLFDLASWITANDSTYTKDGESYTFDTKQSMYSTPFYFSEEDITVSISGIIESITVPSPRLHLLHADGTSAKSGALTPSTTKSENVSCAGLRFDWSSTGGTVKITNLMLNTGSTALPYEPYGNTWNSIPYRKYESATDTITSLPADVIADGQSASANILGNMQQTGTPSPQSIIIPSECGDKTANLFYSSKNQTVGSTLHITQTIGNSSFVLNKDASQSDTSANIDVDITLPAGTYTVSVIGLNLYINDYDRVFLRDDDSTIVVQNVQVNRPQSFTLSETKRIYRATVVAAAQSTYNNTNIQIMLNTGSTALPYQPYGYKIPISCGGTTTPIYLGEVQSTRKIRKYEFTGQETGWNYSTSGGRTRAYISLSDSLGASLCICSHYDYVASSIFYPDIDKFTLNSTGSILIGLDSTIYTDVTAFKSYLAQQYAAGTPVCVWYVLATPTTGIVNEPIRKIGDYADSVSVTGIPTTGTAESFDVDTTLKPSEVNLTYHGWHEHSDTKYTI